MAAEKQDLDVVVLAAGVGTRLRPVTDEVPKCLVEVAGQPILGWLLHQLQDMRELADLKIYVLAGYRAGDVDTFVDSVDLPVNVVINKDYEKTNNMYSLYLSFPHLGPGKDVIVINGDCIYDKEFVEEFLVLPSSAIAVDSSVYYQESMKVRVRDGYVRAISKELQPSADVFTSIDLYRFSGSVREALVKTVSSYVERGELTQWTEVAIHQMLQDEDVYVQTYDIAGGPWMEIDTIEDLSRAEELFR